MSSVFDKITKDKNEPSQPIFSRTKTSNIFYNFRDGDNVLRLVGEYLKVRTHRIAPANFQNWKDIGLCKAAAFQRGEDKLPDTVICADWDMDKESSTDEKTCPICQLNNVARQFLNENGNELDKEGKDFLIGVVQRTTPRTQYKWSVIDRENPEITQTVDGESKQVLGYKVASLGMGAFEDVKGIFNQVKFDISDPEKGIDINIIKSRTPRSDGKSRVTYSAQVVLDGKGLKETPLTDVEKAMESHDLKRLAGKKIAAELIVSNFHEDLHELFVSNTSETPSAEEVPVAPVEPEAPKAEEVPKAAVPKAEAPKVAVPKAEAPKVEQAPEPEAPVEEASENAATDSTEGWECFGTFVEDHDECKGCESTKECAAKTQEVASVKQ